MPTPPSASDEEPPVEDGEDEQAAIDTDSLAPAPRPWRNRLIGWLKIVGILCLIVAAIAGASLWQMIKHYEKDLPSTTDLRHYRPPQVTRILARDGSLLAEVFTERRTVVALHKIARNMRVAVLAAEDADFYQHTGLDYFGMLRALWVNIRSGKTRQGASTITQQVVKNVLLTPERTFRRKVRELLLARRIEQQLRKDEILELYLNHIYFGHGRYGVEEAARYYFAKGASELNLAEAAMLAAIPKGPRYYSPHRNRKRARKRRNHVLEQLARKGFAKSEEVTLAKQAPIVLAPAVESLAELAPEAVAEARRILRERVGPRAKKGGYTITTTIDPSLQAAARSAVRRNLDAYAKRHKKMGPIAKSTRKNGPKPYTGTPHRRGHRIYNAVVTGHDDARGLVRVRVGSQSGIVRLADYSRYNPQGLRPSRFAEKGAILRVSTLYASSQGEGVPPHRYRLELGPQSALVALDVASRDIRALVGSYEAVRGGLDRASRARRQPGSTFKPFVYGYGIQQRRLTAASQVEPPRPANEDEDDPKDPLRLRRAIAFSINRAALWSLRLLGAQAVADFAKRAGIRSRLGHTQSLALGAYELTPRELASAYGTFAGGGQYAEPRLVVRIVGPNGADVPLKPRPPRLHVMDSQAAYLLTDLLRSVIRYGTGRSANRVKVPLAGKTGTTNQSKDAWFAGFSPKLVCVVWTGFDDAIPLGRRESGATAALPAFVDFMQKAHSTGPAALDWPRPKGMLRVAIDKATGLLAYEGQEDASVELFIAGTEPRQVAPIPPEEQTDPYAAAEDGENEEPAESEQSGTKTKANTPTATPSAEPR